MRKPKPFYLRIAEAIIEAETFDLTADDNDYPTIHWLIAEYMLRDFLPFDRNSLLYGSGYPKRVAENFWAAIGYIRDVKRRTVCRYRPRGKKALICVTLNPDYVIDETQIPAIEAEYDRMQARVESCIESVGKHAARIMPERLVELAEDISIAATNILPQPDEDPA